MKNGIEAVTIVYKNSKIDRLKKRMFGSPSYEFERNKRFKITTENKIDVLSTMFFCQECHVSVYIDSKVYRYFIYQPTNDARTS